ncbi:MAG: hypothetical protein PF440_03175 [Thiomicrorhabdus sp.]|jgi:hypothetical protein|nr:hypothetical protein [Thiomicrorhabdus sp.]
MDVHTIDGSCYVKCVDVNELEEELEFYKDSIEILNRAIVFSIEIDGDEGILFLQWWSEGNYDACKQFGWEQ